jgi:succinate-acetate transporter protein
MEAGQLGAREADVAPAPAEARTTGWTPADPGPLGLAAFAATTFVLSVINANLVGAKGIGVILGLSLAYGGIVQVLAGMWEFRTGNTFGAVAFSSYGAFWISVYILLKNLGTWNEAGFALYLYAWAIFTTIMFIASLRTTGAVAIVFLLLTITFYLLAIGHSSLVGSVAATNSTIKLGGWLGIFTAIAAWYTAMAAVMNSTFGRIVLPVVPLKR